jgi:cell pole-organizing protein PopZ
MRKPEQSAEPSIEEILASIRKIIADDGAQHSARAAASPEAPLDTSPRRLHPEARRQPSYPAAAFYPEPDEPTVALGEDDVLELTEDSMVGDGGRHGDTAFAADAGNHDWHDPEPMQAGGRSAPPSGEELESVLSNVVAEVQRLAGVKTAADPLASPVQDWAETAATPQPATPRQPTVPERWDEPARETEPKPTAESTGRFAPAQARPASKPVWSARHLDSEGPRVRAPQPAEDRSPAQPGSGRTAGRGRWADGVQMPVPEGGPAPFPEPEPDDGDNAPPLSGSGERASEIETEKTFVGEMLTRVFGGSQKKNAEAAPPVPARPARAEDLARATITDFASDKLHAPSVGEALQADQPFMDAITGSLASALADHEAAAGRHAASPASMSEDEFPELLPADDEIGLFDAPSERSSGAPADSARKPAAAMPSFAPTPELARESAVDVGAQTGQAWHPAQGEIAGSAAEANRGHAARTVHAAPKPEPAAAVESAPAPAAADMPPQGLTFPSGLEDSIKEMIKPLIVQWLNDNLPRIVERAVREEVADHELVSRARGEGGSRH